MTSKTLGTKGNDKLNLN